MEVLKHVTNTRLRQTNYEVLLFPISYTLPLLYHDIFLILLPMLCVIYTVPLPNMEIQSVFTGEMKPVEPVNSLCSTVSRCARCILLQSNTHTLLMTWSSGSQYILC